MLEKEEKWKLFHELAANIMKPKEKEERERQALQRTEKAANNQQNGG